MLGGGGWAFNASKQLKHFKLLNPNRSAGREEGEWDRDM